ncbi:MFS transporter [Chromobacterium subtsugae]|uniref:MFS transporter n=1 Tax=Chromobacterium subtsugae TaxID=251747 RepID=A0ABS7FEN1_9NEIS|nr:MULTISPECIES: MFS transporter [Chromobacterium]KUM04164.1 MFS transporter [Chromobacterium subtsugae]KZE85736.1 MFS transporter [Chromobacterium sp. F49]MBW7566368.1 MFS transporter [Chromobacterium subtsugae]MBW8287773.1 MFS transporter [Chromobacterium subtsugae]WSE91104.1 MFS transporter [Chromobacterium subtsugae]
MSNRYGQLFRTPGVAELALAGWVARLPGTMVAVGVITMLSLSRNSYSLAGAVAATLTLASALLAPQVSRLADRYGQSRVLPPATGIGACALLALILCNHLHAPAWTLYLCAAPAGCLPSIPAMTRARWARLLEGQPLLPTAFALDSVLSETAFVMGPPLSIGLCMAWFPEAGPLLAALLILFSVSALLRQKATEPPPHPITSDSRRPALFLRPVPVLALLMGTLGAIAGTIDVASVAFAKAQGQPAAAGWVLALYALGSGIGGLAFGALKPALPLGRLLLGCCLATAASSTLIALAPNVIWLAAVMLLSGLSFAPTLIVAMEMVEKAVPRARLTESLTWLVTGIQLGVAGGASLCGLATDAYGARAGLSLALAAGLASLSIAALQPRVVPTKSAC